MAIPKKNLREEEIFVTNSTKGNDVVTKSTNEIDERQNCASENEPTKSNSVEQSASTELEMISQQDGQAEPDEHPKLEQANTVRRHQANFQVNLQ